MARYIARDKPYILRKSAPAAFRESTTYRAKLGGTWTYIAAPPAVSEMLTAVWLSLGFEGLASFNVGPETRYRGPTRVPAAISRFQCTSGASGTSEPASRTPVTPLAIYNGKA